MADVGPILTANFSEALKQLNTYMSLGLTAALSALAIELQTSRQADALAHWLSKGASGPRPDAPEQPKPVRIPFAASELNAEHAKWLLLAATLVAGLLAYMATLSATATSTRLASDPMVLSAICTFPSVATTPRLVRVLACIAPAVLAGAVMWMQGRRLRTVIGNEARDAKYTLLAPFVVVYVLPAMQLYHLPC